MKIIFLIALLKLQRFGYIDPVRCKIIELALVGYEYTSAYSPLRAFFMRKISMLLHLYGEAGEGHLRMCRSLVYLSTNPFQLYHPHLVVTGKAPKQTQGAHSS
ncbi:MULTISPECIES: hypothetical protein [Acinetobacter]|uniref:hypothetical protein n=1 Tax=Acinetobacter TaxID=469 RepID=UPI0015D33A30|nr:MULTISPECIES: hypothetical protein [Acinetobacter]MDV2456261.1 hypothetical protein [Acinetobacter towneri]